MKNIMNYLFRGFPLNPSRRGRKGVTGLPGKAFALALALVFAASLIPAGLFAAPKKAPAKEKEWEGLKYDRAFFAVKKDPLFAGMLSWYMPGLGQYYSEEYVKGTVFLVTEYTMVITSIFYFLNFDFSAGGGSGFKINVDAKRTNLGVISTSRKNIFYGVLTVLFLVHLYNVSDAVKSAKKFNADLEEERIKLRQTYPGMKMGREETRDLYFGFGRSF